MKGRLGSLILILVAGCNGQGTTVDPVTRERGREALQQYGCINCHQIPGVVGSETYVGPTLAGFSRRALVAGVAPNTPASLAQFIQDPDAVAPGTVMPDLRVSAEDARAMAAYLHTLD